jgi:hypothetical protein
VSDETDGLGAELAQLRELVEQLQAGQGDNATALAGLRATVQRIEAVLNGEDDDGPALQPEPSARWWELEGEARDEAITRLADWVDTVYQPGYGGLARGMGACWRSHDLCLYLLDIMREQHRALYLPAKRPLSRLASQAEWHARILPVFADMLARETQTACEHEPILLDSWGAR